MTEAGKDAASIKIPLLSVNKVVDIKAASFNVHGKRTDMDPDNIFDEGNAAIVKRFFPFGE